MQLQFYNSPPPGFVETTPNKMHELLKGPSIVRIEGEKQPPLLVSTLLHGNEPTGILAVQKLLKECKGQTLSREMYVFVGNIWAAEQDMRRLPEQLDFNRIWKGGERPEHILAEELKNFVAKNGVFANIDVHNNSGRNPHYSAISSLKPQVINLAAMFSDRLVYFIRPDSTQSVAMLKYGPSLTLEAGPPSDHSGVDHVCRYLKQVLDLDEVSVAKPDSKKLELYHSVARIDLPMGIKVDVGNQPTNADVTISADIESLNFANCKPGTQFGWCKEPLIVTNEDGEDVGANYLNYTDGRIVLKQSTVPSMLTKNVQVMRQDCVGYLMTTMSL